MYTGWSKESKTENMFCQKADLFMPQTGFVIVGVAQCGCIDDRFLWHPISETITDN